MSPLTRALNGVVRRALDVLGDEPRPVPDPREARLLPAAAPATTEERLIVETLAGPGSLRVDALVARVSLALYREELSHGGAAADLGLFGSSLFVPAVRRALETGRDRLWTLSPQS